MFDALVEYLLAVFGEDELVALRLQDCIRQLPILGLVVDDKDYALFGRWVWGQKTGRIMGKPKNVQVAVPSRFRISTASIPAARTACIPRSVSS